MKEDGAVTHPAITPERIGELLTPDNFLRWLRTFEKRSEEVGVTGDSEWCPLARYFKDALPVGDPFPAVSVIGDYLVAANDWEETFRYRMPEWAYRFVMLADEGADPDYPSKISRRMATTLLNRAIRETVPDTEP